MSKLKSGLATTVRRAAVGAAALVAVTGTALVGTSPALAAPPVPSCSTWKSADLHTGYAKCTLSQPSTGTFRVKVQFCTTANCNWAYGDYKFFGNTSSKTNNYAYVNAVSYDLGPAGGRQ